MSTDAPGSAFNPTVWAWSPWVACGVGCWPKADRQALSQCFGHNMVMTLILSSGRGLLLVPRDRPVGIETKPTQPFTRICVP